MGPPAHIVSLGCRLNTYEADRMARLAGDAVEGETVVVNTCAVTAEAVRQSRQAIRRAARHHPGATILVSGCAAETDREAFAAMPEVAALIGNGEKLDPAAYADIHGTAPRPVAEAVGLSRAPVPPSRVEVRTHLEVQNGCDHRCTFCIIPLGRGRARSKPPEDVAAEGRELAARGAREIVLTGVDLTSYGPDLGPGVTIADAVEALLLALPSEVTLRLSSIDGAEVDDRLFRLVTQEPRIAPHLHLSLQAGDDMILKRMKRRHTRADAVHLATRLIEARPEIALGADLIAGFPTETEEMFARTAALIDDAGLAYVHVFPYSARDGTPAARMPQLPREVVKARAARLREAADRARTRHLDRLVGVRDTLLVETVRDGAAVGKLPNFADARLAAAARPGERVSVLVAGHDTRGLTVVRAPGEERTHD